MDLASNDYELSTSSFWTWDAIYEILGVIKKDTRATESRLFVKVVKEKLPSIIVMCEKQIGCFPREKGMFINSNSFIPLKVECIEDCGDGDLNYEWEVSAIDLDSLKFTQLENWEEHTIIDYDRIGLNQSLYHTFSSYRTFSVKATGIRPNMTPGISSIFLTLNDPPENGKCEINATSGKALLDMFSVKFSGWIDKNQHNITDYSIYVRVGEELLRILYGEKQIVDVVLPYGDLEVLCTVSDQFKATTTYSIANFSTTLPTEEELEEYESKRPFERSLAEGKMSLASQMVIAKNSILMEYRNRKGVNDRFDEVSEKDVDLRWQEYLELEGIDNSYFTSQAREEIYDDLQEKLDLQMDKEALEKDREIFRLLRLPMESLADAEIFGGALSAVSEIGPTDATGKAQIMTGIEHMYSVINETEVTHPEDLKVVFSQFGNLADILTGTLAESNMGGKFLPAEMRAAEEFLDFNSTEPNNFIYFIEGNREEVKEKLKERLVDEIKDSEMSNTKGMVSELKEMISEIQQKCIEEIMVGPDPFYSESKLGFQLTFIKNYASELSGQVIQQGSSSIILPDLCKALQKNECQQNGSAIGIQAVRWTQPLESYAENSNNLSDSSNEIQLDITSRDGHSKLSVNDSKDPFIICIPVSASDDKDTKMEYVVPKFPTSSDVLVYHSVLVDAEGMSVTLTIEPDYPNVPLIMVYKYGDYPSLQDYDGIQNIQGGFTSFFGKDIITSSGKNLTIGIGQLGNSTSANEFFKNPKKNQLNVVNMTNQFSTNYSINIGSIGCYHFSDAEEKWITGGCDVSKVESGVTCCACNHLTSFGSGFFVTPNQIDFNYVFAHAGFNQNIAIYVTIIVMFSAFIVLIIFARFKDRKDLEKIGATPLEDNEAEDKYIYEILVYTGHQRNAGTKSNVFFILSGDDEETQVRCFSDQKRPILQRGAIDVFIMSVPRSLGQLNYLRLWHDNSGSGKWSSWYCQLIIFRDVQTGFKYEFLINRWFAVELDDGMIDRLIPVAGKEQVTEFSHMFSTTSQRKLADNHLWFSIFLRPPRSRFTRVQRVSCCMAVLCLSMLTNAMYYERTSAKPASGAFKFGPLSLSPEQIAVGVVTNLLIFPPTFIMIFFFRKSRPRILRPSHVEEALKQQSMPFLYK
nr:uncharacterized protein LOC122269722 [Parasteatoda tepidariorum]